MSDVASGKSLIGTANSLLSECVWGMYPLDTAKESRKPSDWRICFDKPSTIQPAPHSVTYGTYLEDFTLTSKKDRLELKTNFTADGRVGEPFREYLKVIIDALQLNHVGMTKNEKVDKLFKDGYCHTLPSFFNLILYMVQQNLNFRILFRTFGVDIANVAQEFNLFCEGQHPGYLNLPFLLDGSDDRYGKDLRLHLPAGSGCLKRTGEGFNGLHMAYVCPTTQTAQIATGHHQVDRVIMDSWFRLNSPTCSELCNPDSNPDPRHHTTLYCAAVRDDFRHWHDICDEADEGGKLFLVNHSSGSDYGSGSSTHSHKESSRRVIEVFFDDNIERDRAHIVDVRDRQTFAPVSFEEANRRYLRRVEPYLAITDPDYYIRELQDICALHGI